MLNVFCLFVVCLFIVVAVLVVVEMKPFSRDPAKQARYEAHLEGKGEVCVRVCARVCACAHTRSYGTPNTTKLLYREDAACVNISHTKAHICNFTVQSPLMVT